LADKLKRLWHAKDNRFYSEEVQANFALKMPKFTLRQDVLANMFTGCLSLASSQEFAKVFDAGYFASIYSMGDGFEFTFGGHDDKIQVRDNKGKKSILRKNAEINCNHTWAWGGLGGTGPPRPGI